jgi:putative oxidoreductase
MAISLSIGLLILRLVAGATLAAHGAQKLFGWFGGSGINGTLQIQERMGLKPAPLWAGMVILGEFGGGLSVIFGLLTPLGAAGIFGAMFMAIARSHWKNGFWNRNRGIEFPLQLLAASVAIGIAGPGRFSLDALFGINLTTVLFVILALVALLVDVIGLFMGRGTTVAPAPPAGVKPTANPS